VARAANGDVWRRLWAMTDRLVLEFVDVCRLEVTSDRAVWLDRSLSDDMTEHLLLDHVVPLVLAARGLVVLHGAVVSSGGAAIVAIGRSGSGKSTLAAYLGAHGWDVGGDDGAVVHRGRPPMVEPTYPSLRLTAASVAMLSNDVTDAATVVGKYRVPPAQGFAATPVPLAGVVSLAPTQAEDVHARRFDPVEAHAALFGSAFHHDLGDRDGVASMLAALGELVECTPVFELQVGRGIEALAAAEEVLRAIVRAQPVSGSE
jgi:hypothetical protein